MTTEIVAMVRGGDAWLITFCDGVCSSTHTVCSECNVCPVDDAAEEESYVARLPFCSAEMLSVRVCGVCIGRTVLAEPFGVMTHVPAMTGAPCVVCADATEYCVPDVGMAHVRRNGGVLCGAVFPFGVVSPDPGTHPVCPECDRARVWPERKPEVTTVMPYPNGEEGRDWVVNSRPDEDGFIPTAWFQFGQYALAVRYDGYGIEVAITPTDDGLTDLAACETRALAE